jgi:hypothetical protein
MIHPLSTFTLPSPLPSYSITPYDRGSWLISRDEGATYLVDLEEGTCTCDDYIFRGPKPCKHIRAVALHFLNQPITT